MHIIFISDVAKKSTEIISSHSEESNSKTLNIDEEGNTTVDAVSDISNQLEKTKFCLNQIIFQKKEKVQKRNCLPTLKTFKKIHQTTLAQFPMKPM